MLTENQALEIIKNKLGEHKQRGSQLIFKTCPFCGGNKNKFFLGNSKGYYAFDCKSGSCAEKGGLAKLLEHLEITDKVEKVRTEPVVPVDKKIRIDFSKFVPMEKECYGIKEYWNGRGISDKTLIDLKLAVRKYDQATSFFTINKETEEYYAVKYRPIDKNGTRQEVGSKSFLWNRHNLNTGLSEIHITEGEVDALTLIEMGVDNVVSMPMGCSDMNWITNEWDLLKKFDKINLYYDNDGAGAKGLKECAKRLDFARLLTIDYNGFNDVNDFFMNDTGGLMEALENPVELEVEGIVDITKIKASSSSLNESVSCGDPRLDYIMNGWRFNELTILTAESGVGKSTMLCNLTADLLHEGERVFLYSGELSDQATKSWQYQILGGADSCDFFDNRFRVGEKIPVLKPEIEKKIDGWVENRLFLYEGGIADGFELVKKMELYHKRYGIRFFFIDNLTVLNLGNGSKYDGQSEFSKVLADFIRTNQVHVILVAHPKKAMEKESNEYIKKDGSIKEPRRLNRYDVSGSADITNLAHNVLIMQRCNRNWKAWLKQESENNRMYMDFEEASTVMFLDKNRMGGTISEDVIFRFDVDTKRFYGLNDEDKVNKKYGWMLGEEFNVDELPDF